MPGLGWSAPLKGLAAILCGLVVLSLALIYFIPAPPSKIGTGIRRLPGVA